jgi:hypothetical protein
MRRPLLSPAGLAIGALVLALLYGVVHAAGLRADASILSGSAPPDELGVPLGLAYVILYFGFVVLAPVAVIAAALMAIYQRLTT